VPKRSLAARNFYDVWLPQLAPSQTLLKGARPDRDPRDLARFVRRYRAEMKRPEASRLLDLLAALSRHANLAVGCYCADETRCHRSVLRTLLHERGAELA
jgi:uncharacterized protein YeaO (DUF488 family)